LEPFQTKPQYSYYKDDKARAEQAGTERGTNKVILFLKKKKNKAVLVVLHRLKMYSTADSDATEKALRVRLVKSLARQRLAHHLIRAIQQ